MTCLRWRPLEAVGVSPLLYDDLLGKPCMNIVMACENTGTQPDLSLRRFWMVTMRSTLRQLHLCRIFHKSTLAVTRRAMQRPPP